jgi:hypothetical protein
MKKLVSILLFILIFTNLYAQDSLKGDRKPAFMDRIFFGGDLGLQFGTYTFINVSPVIGYKFTEKVVGGFGITYQYLSYSDVNLSTNIYGGSLFGRYYILENLFAHAEYQLLNLEPFYVNYSTGNIYKGSRMNVESYLVGGGYRQPISGNASFNILVLWNLSNSIYSPYSNPIIRAGFNIGL